MPRPRNNLATLADLQREKTDYAMAKRSGQQSRRRRGVPSSGAGADYHYSSESDWLWMQELAWDMYRNDMVVGSIVDKVTEYTVQDGFAFNPQTGDRKLDQDLKDWFTDWSIDPDECDPAGEAVFFEQEQHAFRSTLVGGDLFAVPVADEGPMQCGAVDLIEGQMCRSATRGKNKNILHGVEMQPGTRRRIGYDFANEPIDPWQQVLRSQLTRTPAYYFDDLTGRQEKNVFHVRFTKRAKQTRGVTAFTPLFNVANYHDDIQFLSLVQKRNAALFVFLEQRSAQFDPKYLAADIKMGTDVTAEKALSEVEALNKKIDAVSPGSILRSLPGSQLELNTTNIPAPEHFMHTELLLTLLGINLGFPLVMTLMDVKQGSYSSIRSAVTMAKNGFLRNQTRLMMRFHQPYMRFKMLKRAERDRAFAKLVRDSVKPGAKINVFSYWWTAPKWESIDPGKDASAELVRSTSMQESPRRLANERGREWTDIVRETIADRRQAIRLAVRESQKINSEFKLEGQAAVAWRDLAPLPVPERVTVTLTDSGGGEDQQPPKPPAPEQQPAKS